MGYQLSWTLHANSTCSGIPDSTLCHHFPPAPWHEALARSYKMASLQPLMYEILNIQSSLQLVFPIFHPPVFIVINSGVSLSFCQCSCPSLSWISVVLTAYFHALPHSVSLLRRMSSFLRTSLGWNGSCLSLSLKASLDLLTFLSQEKRKDLCVTGN